jgi:segregation and condensation protein A
MPEDMPDLDPEGFGEAAEAEALQLDIEGYEGPLDLLLALARKQRVDLRGVSILQLAEQYLAFVAEARRMRIELAADYLVMAAWLAYLKSRLLLPPPHEDGPSGEELAARLQRRLARLEAIRKAATRLMARDQLNRDFFARGEPENTVVETQVHWNATLADLLKAYGRLKSQGSKGPLQLRRAPVFSLEEAYARLRALLGDASGPGADWAELVRFLPEGWGGTPERRRSALASTFAATLELAKRGELELRQDGDFAPLRLRARAGEAG